jgi:hypothetical protein
MTKRADSQKATSDKKLNGENVEKPKKTRIACAPFPKLDPVAEVVFGKREPESVLAKVVGPESARIVGMRITDSPLDYLAHRLPADKRLDPQQYEAATRYRDLVNALGSTGQSNINIVLDAAAKAVPLTKIDREMLANGAEFMAARDDARQLVTPETRMLASAWSLRRLREKLDEMDLSLLDDLIIRERPVGLIGQRWGWSPEAAGVVVRLALWRLARALMETDHEFAAWVGLYRQQTGQARE